VQVFVLALYLEYMYLVVYDGSVIQ